MSTEEMMTLDEVAGGLRVERHTAKRYVSDGLLTAFKCGRIYRIRREDFEAFVARHTLPAAEKKTA